MTENANGSFRPIAVITGGANLADVGNYSPDFDAPGSIGGKCGCALAAIIGIPLVMIAVGISAIGDCLPEDACDRSLDWGLIAAALVMTAIVGLGSRAIINAIARRSKGHE